MSDSLIGRVANPDVLTEAVLDSTALQTGVRDASTASDDSLGIPNRLFGLMNLARAVLEERPDLRYWVMVGLRAFHRVPFSPATAHVFHALARATSKLKRGRKFTFTSLQQFYGAVCDDSRSQEKAGPDLKLFVQCCLSVHFIRADPTSRTFEMLTDNVDPEFLISVLFGTATQIPGFDDLFGGGGIILSDHPADIPNLPEHLSVEPAPAENDIIGGRTVLVIGPFGTGKSLLSLQMAVEIARKGGIAWVMAFEQSAEECLYALESMGISTDNEYFSVARDLPTALNLLRRPERGALVFVRQERRSTSIFLKELERSLPALRRFPLRLIIVDPVNAIGKSNPPADTLRASTIRLFERAKAAGVNIWMTAEQQETGDTPYQENIADTVMHLNSDRVDYYTQRYIEITKSRLQRAHLGRHAFTIMSGSGVQISPSSVALLAIGSARSVIPPGKPIDFGLAGLDTVLGAQELRSGDLIVIKGPPGLSKTMVGLSFLMHARPDRKGSIVFTDEDASALRRLEEGFPSSPRPTIVEVPRGYIEPGEILQRLGSAFAEIAPDRVMIGDVGRWELSMPLLQQDRAFGITLMEFLRRRQASCVIICSDIPDATESRIRRSVIDSADCVIELAPVQFGGHDRVSLRVERTRRMRHRREPFELVMDDSGSRVENTLALLRFGPNRETRSVPIRLFLHAETPSHERYHQKLVGAIRTSIAPDSQIEVQSRRYDPDILDLGYASAVDELQILQLDEFQLPALNQRSPHSCPLYIFTDSADRNAGRFRYLTESVRAAGTSGYFAVPFYVNVGLLAFRGERFSSSLPSTWEDLAKMCSDYENDDPVGVWFDCPVANLATVETYNCFFLEILLSGHANRVKPNSDITHWLSGDAGLKAAFTFRTLCQRSYLKHVKPRLDGLPPQGSVASAIACREAACWRHWHNTLNHMLAEMHPNDRQDIQVVAPFGGFTTAGEWYLALPSYSAAPEIGLSIIDVLTRPEAELERVRLGVGLPTRTRFYKSDDDRKASSTESASPLFSLSSVVLNNLIEHAFRRSDFRGYRRFAGAMSSNLQKILEIPAELTKQEIEDRIASIMRSVITDIQFVQGSYLASTRLK